MLAILLLHLLQLKKIRNATTPNTDQENTSMKISTTTYTGISKKDVSI
jgi:hypothetical protein